MYIATNDFVVRHHCSAGSINHSQGHIEMAMKQPLPTHTYKYIATNFGDIAYREAGSGPAAIFVHGFLLNGHLWDRLIERLAGVRRCIAIDILAHGATGARADQDLSFDAQADMLAAGWRKRAALAPSAAACSKT
jgi:hypothetical protein